MGAPRCVAALVGIALAIAYHIDVVALFGLIHRTSWMAYSITDIIISCGSDLRKIPVTGCCRPSERSRKPPG